MKMKKWLFVRIGLIAASAIAYAIQGPVSAHAAPPIDMRRKKGTGYFIWL